MDDIMTNLPSWIQALTSVIGLIAIVKLFLKDNDRKKEIDALIKMAEAQEQLNENNSTLFIEMKKQSLALVEANEISNKQLEILHLQYESDLKIENRKLEIENHKLDIEKIKRRDEIKPNFNFDGSTGNGKEIKLKITNIGETALDIRISFLQCSKIQFSDLNKTMDKIVNKQTFVVTATTVENHHVSQYIIKIEYKDIDGNNYYQNLSWLNCRRNVNDPIFIE